MGTSLTVQWLRLRASNAGDTGSIPGRGTKIPHATHGMAKKTKSRQKKKTKKITRDKEGHYILIRDSKQQEDITVIR